MHDNENLTTDRPTFVTHLECSMTGEHYAADRAAQSVARRQALTGAL